MFRSKSLYSDAFQTQPHVAHEADIFVLAERCTATERGPAGNVCMHTAAPIASIRATVCCVPYQARSHVPLQRQNTLSRS